ncbi:hypothetical protein PMZ80_004139 [Knufia obscura]|uniref:Uncharacterized protein n=1 Tax=Knufia obscura TaxID=1635080 RepID=A0ABR0RSA1_9EURO|nr:hypothetical protein PMZ80_004139 [Knufia obscura]
MATGVLMTSAGLLAANVTDVNETHAGVSLWKPAASSATGPPEAVTVATIKRPWSSESPSAWPAALYDAFHALYTSHLEQSTMTDGDSTILNASQLFHAVYGQAVMAQCATTIADQLLLVQHNTATGPVVEAVTHTDIAADTVQHVYQRSGHIEDQVLDAQRKSAQQQASLAVKLERLHTVSDEVVEGNVGMAALRSHSILVPPSRVTAPQAYEDLSLPLCSCTECQIQIQVRLKKLCHAQTVSAQKRASLATKLAQLQRISHRTLHDVVRAEDSNPPDATASSTSALDRPRGTKRKRPGLYSTGPWPSEMT